MEGGNKGVARFGRDVHLFLVVKMSIFILPIFYRGLRNRGVLLCKFSMAWRTRGSEEEEFWI